jgi:type VI secretion system secreted protein VgrG
MNVVIQAGMQLSLVGPGGFISITPAGVAIQGTMVLINSGGAAGSAQSASPSSPDSPDSPEDPKDPDTADDGTKGGKLNQ